MGIQFIGLPAAALPASGSKGLAQKRQSQRQAHPCQRIRFQISEWAPIVKAFPLPRLLKIRNQAFFGVADN